MSKGEIPNMRISLSRVYIYIYIYIYTLCIKKYTSNEQNCLQENKSLSYIIESNKNELSK